MKPKSLLTVILLSGLWATPAAFCQDAAKEDALYSDGTRAINDGRWMEAEQIFNGIARQHGSRAEAALYWKAYAENKEGKPREALETCNQLRMTFPHGKWLNECGALEIEIHGKNNDPVPPQKEQDEELKLLALNALMQQDESRSLPVIQQILSSSNNSEKLKSRALFVLAQSHSQQGQAMLDKIARNSNDEALQRKAIQMMAVGQGKQAAPALADIYRQSTDEQVKKSVLNAYLMLGTPEPLLDAAQHESNPDLARSAVRELAAMGAVPQLMSFYHDSKSAEVKGTIIDSMVAAGSKGADALAGIAANEQDAALRVKAIRMMGAAGGSSVTPALMTMYAKNADPETRKAVIQSLFVAGDSHDLVELARAEKDPVLRKQIVQQLSVMNSKESTEYMLEILNK